MWNCMSSHLLESEGAKSLSRKMRKGCFCRDGFVRDSSGKCILPQLCPVVCKENEIFQNCSSPCQRTCESMRKPLSPCTLPCVKGCSCKPGHVR
ncbi:zonadhesin [Caerostris extrusa]|uniref:Zonadhesin n=1 Tax=Caerostris extrusa TaxID=172846 RepID=A0AAV4MAS5_CAEEX|nr:zonadhesin [Caerostris extrusa]